MMNSSNRFYHSWTFKSSRGAELSKLNIFNVARELTVAVGEVATAADYYFNELFLYYVRDG